VRELTSGIYFGRPQGRNEAGTEAFDTCTYTRTEIERVLDVAFRLAMSRRRRLTVVDKANVLETSRLWREVAQDMAPRYPEVELEFMFVDNAAMQIVRQPTHFDVIVTENMFGDILTDEASVISGSSACSPRRASGRKWRSSSRSTAPIRRLRGRTSPTRWPRSSRPPCCSNTWGSTRRAAPCGPP